MKLIIKIVLIGLSIILNSNAGNIVHPYSIVFVYVGNELPHYLKYSIFQARLFNKNCNIFLLINTTALNNSKSLVDKLKKYRVLIVNCESLVKSDEHREFDAIYNKHSIDGYWKLTTERFFYIDELMRQYNLKDVFQVECDVMLYINLENYLTILHDHYKEIACPFQNDYLASVSFTYFSNPEAIKKWVKFIPQIQRGQVLDSDMHLLAAYKNYALNKEVDHLPTISKDLIRCSILKNQRGEIAPFPWKYWNHIEEWDSIFDNDGIGTFLEENAWKFNQAFFDSSFYKFMWKKDHKNRLIPYAISPQDCKYRINTLHIASKKLDDFLSIKK